MSTEHNIHDLDEDWNATDEGDASCYTTPPELVPVSHAARVIYELRLDIQRLNEEAMELTDRLLVVEP